MSTKKIKIRIPANASKAQIEREVKKHVDKEIKKDIDKFERELKRRLK